MSGSGNVPRAATQLTGRALGATNPGWMQQGPAYQGQSPIQMNYQRGAPVQAGAGYQFNPMLAQQMMAPQGQAPQQMALLPMPVSPWAGMPSVAQSVQQINSQQAQGPSSLLKQIGAYVRDNGNQS